MGPGSPKSRTHDFSGRDDKRCYPFPILPFNGGGASLTGSAVFAPSTGPRAPAKRANDAATPGGKFEKSGAAAAAAGGGGPDAGGGRDSGGGAVWCVGCVTGGGDGGMARASLSLKLLPLFIGVPPLL